MGEKLFAQRMLGVLRNTVGAASREAGVALEWAGDQRDWLWPGRAWATPKGRRGAKLDWQSLPALLEEMDTAGGDTPLFDGVRRTVELLELGAFDAALLNAVAAFHRLPRLAQLRSRLTHAGADLMGLFGQIAGADAADGAARVRRSAALRLGLVVIDRDYASVDLELDWRFGRILDDALVDDERLIEGLAGARQPATLTRADFAEREADVDLLVRLLRGALAKRERGVNLLIYGPPGTGKTELARTLAAEVGAALFAVGEADVDGAEPSRSERLFALNRAQRLLARRGNSLLLFDEMEDLFAEASWCVGGQQRSGSKIFVNRLLEEVAVPVIWTSNSLKGVDPAHLRRLSFVLRMSHASPNARARIAARAAEAADAGAAVGGRAPPLEAEAEAASIAPAAIRTAALAGGNEKDAAAAAESLLLGIRGGRALPPPMAGEVDLSLYAAETDLAQLVDRVSRADSPSDFSLLLTGPPGTGKTAFAAHLARRLDRPLAVKRASDLLSMWVGQTEANIAAAFAEARDAGSVLLFDEADSLLLDRSDAQRSWEITQVNELLTWMDNHPLPFVAATNFARRLDPATLRRFVFKVDLQPLDPALARLAFERFFDRGAPDTLAELRGLTPGDFAVVRRQLRYRRDASPGEIVAMLRREVDAKPEPGSRLGF